MDISSTVRPVPEHVVKQEDDIFYEVINLGPGHPTSMRLRLATPEKCEELRLVLQRALSTWEPEKVPSWVTELQDALCGMTDLVPTPAVADLPMIRNALCDNHCVSRVNFQRDFCLCKGEDKVQR